MKKFIKNPIITLLVVSFMLVALGFTGSTTVLAATTPSLGIAATYGVLGSTYTNTSAGTTINGDVGFTTGPAVLPLGTHANYGSGAPYSTAGTDQGSALTNLNGQACTFTFGGGAINLSTDTTHGAIGVYAPGVYCGSGAMDVGGPLTLSGSGTYIFRPGGALTTTAGAIVTLSGASACDVFWTPIAATTLAANTTFAGTVISDAGITVGANTTWTGRALSFGGTTTTDTDTITVPTCTSAPAPATLHIIKQVVNNNGGTATASLFNLYVKSAGTDVTGSPAVGIVTPGRSYTLSAGTYVVSEDANTSYTQSFSGDCNASGSVTLTAGADRTCTITNTDIASTPPPASATLHIIKQVVNNNGGTATASLFNLHVKLAGTDVTGSPAAGTVTPGTSYSLSAGTYAVSEDANTSYTQSFSGDCNASGSVILIAGDNKTCTITNTDIAVSVVLPATISVVKIVINDNGGTKAVADFPLFVNGTLVTSGAANTFSTGAYTVTETGDANYASTFSGDCDSSGQLNLIAGDNKTCTITNNDIAIAPTVIPKLPKTGIAPDETSSAPWNIIVPTGIFAILLSFYIARKKWAI